MSLCPILDGNAPPVFGGRVRGAAVGEQHRAGGRRPESSTRLAAAAGMPYTFANYVSLSPEDRTHNIFVIITVVTFVYWSLSLDIFPRVFRWPWHWRWILDRWACVYVLLTRPRCVCVACMASLFLCVCVYVSLFVWVGAAGERAFVRAGACTLCVCVCAGVRACGSVSARCIFFFFFILFLLPWPSRLTQCVRAN